VVQGSRAYCALCREVLRPDDDVLVTPDFLADETDPFWRFADAAMHRPCFLVWDRRKTFVARYNRLARRWSGPDGSYPFMTSEGDMVKLDQSREKIIRPARKT
jgi:hypothetical protein